SLVQATFVECKLGRADFTGANLHRSTFVSCVGEGVRFTRARLDQAVLSHRNELPAADLTEVQAERCCARTTVFTRARFDRAHMPLGDLSGCDLRGAVLDRAVLDRALLIRAQLGGASLR